jgi:hypothetical protein
VPSRPTQKRPARPGSNASDTDNNASPAKRGAGNPLARRGKRYRAWDLALSYGPRCRETLRAHLWDGGGWPHAERKPAHGASGNGGNWSIETLLRFLLFGEAGVDALAQTRRVHFVTLITRRKQ